MFVEVLCEDDVGTRCEVLLCGFGDGGTELRSGGIVGFVTVNGAAKTRRQKIRRRDGSVGSHKNANLAEYEREYLQG